MTEELEGQFDDDDEKVRKVQDHRCFAGRCGGATPKIEIPLV